MALVGLSLVLASISLFFCRSQAISTVARFWSAARGQKKEQTQIKERGAPNKPCSAPNGIPKETLPQLNMPSSSSQREKDNDVSASSSKANDSIPTVSDRSSPPRAVSTSQTKPDLPATPSSMSDAQLMPPPPRPTRTPARPQSTSSTTLRVPTSGPLPNRGPPSSNSLSRPSANSLNATSAATTSTLPAASRPRKKVLLAPGHSPLDWAEKTRTSTSQALSGVPYPQRITHSQLAWATGRKGKPAWSAYKGRVYNIGPYLPFHPGGEAELMRAAGRDGQSLFDEIHSWVNWENMLDACFVGWLVNGEAGAEDSAFESLD